MERTRNRMIFGVLAAIVLALFAGSSAEAQTWVVYPNYGPWGPIYGPYYPSYPGPLYAPMIPARSASPVVRASAYGAAADDDTRPSYYSEDYSGPETPAAAPSKVAYIRVRVPERAELWINGEKRKQAGAVREFVTPALDPEHIYVYNVRARWTEEGGIGVEKTLRVRTISGTRVTVNFVRPPAAQPRTVVRAAAAPAPSAPRVEQQPVDWTSGPAPRSFSPPRP